MSKARLEEIIKQVKRSDEYAEKGLWEASDGMIVHLHNEGDIAWLIEQAGIGINTSRDKRALIKSNIALNKRVQELEEIKIDAIKLIDVSQRRNERLEKRVLELENKLARIRFINNDYDKRNKRYRETIEEAIEYANSPKILTSPAGIEEILSKALEGESNE